MLRPPPKILLLAVSLAATPASALSALAHAAYSPSSSPLHRGGVLQNGLATDVESHNQIKERKNRANKICGVNKVVDTTPGRVGGRFFIKYGIPAMLS
ncbi:hypothetical protein ZEAMMB73_Zm00001d025968 [Zea mays]|uniref:Uncharacterized protein n=1 Tax=Zea mays TaxID=4577 RepID=A0A1D6JBB2_MAIZE|nr:hypothetical protein ZEAMMB73_Zm00001d025968 [Zea mays]